MDAHPQPFHDGTKVQWAWDSTSLGWLKECPRKYQYHMIEQWRGRGESIHLEYGILYHAVRGQWERSRAAACYVTLLHFLGPARPMTRP